MVQLSKQKQINKNLRWRRYYNGYKNSHQKLLQTAICQQTGYSKNRKKVGRCLDTYNLPKLNQNTETLVRPISKMETKSIIKTVPVMKTQDCMLRCWILPNLQRRTIPIPLKLFKIIESTLSNSFHEIKIMLIQTPEKYTNKKTNILDEHKWKKNLQQNNV